MQSSLRRSRNVIFSVLALSFVTVVAASASGLLGALPAMAPPFAAASLLLTGMVVYAVLPSFRAAMLAFGVRRITAIHILRIMAAPLFFWYGAHHLLPHIFVQRAAWGDVLAGLAALTAVLWNRVPGYWIAHIIGLLDFVEAFATAIGQTGKDAASMHAITGLPMALIPFWAVGLLAITHIIALHVLLRNTGAEIGQAASRMPQEAA